MKKFIALAIVASLLAGCEAQGPKQSGGTLMGAGAGALMGSAIAGRHDQGFGIVMGALIGGMLGNAVGKSLDDQDRAMMGRAQYNAFERNPSGQASYWSNPDSGHSGYVTPRPAMQRDGQTCREYTQEITIGGKRSEGYGTACRQQDGSWKIINSN
jgi:surface antigen